MAHPHNEHRQSKVEHARVAHITKGYASGGAVHPDAVEDAKLVKGLVKKTALKVDGKKAKHRADRPQRAKGGRIKSGKTNVNVIIAPQGGGDKPAMPGPMAGAPMPPKPMLPPPGAVPPPGLGAAPPPSMPPRAHGGRAYKHGGGVKSGPGWTESMKAREPYVDKSSDNKDDQKDIGRGRSITYRRGGAVEASDAVAPATKLPGGSGGGKGRLAKAKRAAKT